jgi:uncharacterized protein
VKARNGLLLAPGAGSGRDHPTLVAIDQAATATGARVVRMDFPYRKAGRRSPDRPEVLVDAVRTQAAELAKRCERLAMGGRSMGGRICSLAAAEGVSAAGLFLVSYPLHPPGRPEQLRTGHFDQLKVPCLFVSGTRDAFGTPEELRSATAAIAGPVTHHFIEGKDHALRGSDDLVASMAVDWLDSLG